MKNHVFYSCKFAGIVFISAIFLLIGGPAMAQDLDVTAVEAAKEKKNAVGLGAAAVPDYEGSSDYQAAPFLQLRFNWGNQMYFSLLGNTATLNLIPSETWHFGPLVRYRAERKDVENDRVDAMEDVDAAVEVGAFLSYNLPNWIFLLSAAQDVADAHDGYVANAGLGYRFNLQEETLMTLFALTTYASDDYMETYFGITPVDSARSGLPTFTPDAELKDVGGGLLVQHNFDSHWGILGVAKYTKLLGDASDSPIVDDEGDENQGLVGVLVNYRF